MTEYSKKDCPFFIKNALYVCMLLLLAILPSSSFAQSISTSPQSLRKISDNSALTLEELQSNSVLNLSIAVQGAEERLDSLLEKLSLKSGIKLTSDASLVARRLTVKFSKIELSALMSNIAKILYATWRKTETGFEIFQTPGQIASCIRLKEASRNNESAFRQKQLEALNKMIQHEIAKPVNERSPTANVVASVDPELLQQCMNASLIDIPVGSADNNSHLRDHFYSIGAVSFLSSIQKTGVAKLAETGQLGAINEKSIIGLVGADGFIRVAVVDEVHNDLRLCGTNALGGVAIPSMNNSREDYDIEIQKKRAYKQLLDLKFMPVQLRKKLIKIDQIHDVNRLADWLARISEQIGVNFVSDCFLNSATLRDRPQLPGGLSYTVEKVLEEVADKSYHTIKFDNDSLIVKSLTPGLDLRLEPTTDVLNSIDKLIKIDSVPNREDLLVLGKCTRDQLNMIQFGHKAMSNPFSIYVWQATKIYPFLQFYTQLSVEQKKSAWSETGLSVRELLSKQLPFYQEMMNSGRVKLVVKKFSLRKNAFYMKASIYLIKGKFHREIISFIATMPNDPKMCRRAGL